MATVACIVVGLSAVEAESTGCSTPSIELSCWEVQSIDAAAQLVTAVPILGATVIQYKVSDPARPVHSVAAGWSATLGPVKEGSVELAESALSVLSPRLTVGADHAPVADR